MGDITAQPANNGIDGAIQMPAGSSASSIDDQGVAHDVKGNAVGTVNTDAKTPPPPPGFSAVQSSTPAGAPPPPPGFSAAPPPPPGFKPADKQVSPSGVVQDQHEPFLSQPDGPTSMSARKSGKFEQHALQAVTGTGVGVSGEEFHNWLQDIQSDVRNGTDNTWFGAALKKMGNKGTGYGVSEGVQGFEESANPIAALPMGLSKLTEGGMEFLRSSKEVAKHMLAGDDFRTSIIKATTENPNLLKQAEIGANKVVGGAFQAAGPVTAALAPEATLASAPVITAGMAAQHVGTKTALAMGMDPDDAEMVGNVLAIGTSHIVNAKINPLTKRFGAAVSDRTAAEAEYNNRTRNLETARGQQVQAQSDALDAAQKEAATHADPKSTPDQKKSASDATVAARQNANDAAGNVTDAQKAHDVATKNRADSIVQLEGLHRQISAIAEKENDKFDDRFTSESDKAKDLFEKAVPSKGAHQYDAEDYDVWRAYMERAKKAGKKVNSFEDAYGVTEAQRKSIETSLDPAVEKLKDNPITTNPYEDVQKGLAEAAKIEPGILDEAADELSKYNLKDLTVGEARETIKRFNSQNRSMMKEKNNWDVNDMMAKDPAFAARYLAAKSLREGFYGALKNAGVEGAEQARSEEASLIQVRDAIGAQIRANRGGVTVRGSGEQSRLRSVLAKLTGKTIEGAATAKGAMMGATVGEPAGGALLGNTVGQAIADPVTDLIAPRDITRDEHIQKSLELRGTLRQPTRIKGIEGAASSRPSFELPPDVAEQMPAAIARVPRENTELHAELAAHYLDANGENTYQQLEDRLRKDVSVKAANDPASVTPAEKTLLAKVIKLDKVDAAAIAKSNEAQPTKPTDATTPDQQKTIKQIQTDAAAKAGDGRAPSTVEVNPILNAQGRGDESALVSHSPAMKAHAKPLEIKGLEDGMTSDDVHREEWAHAALAAVDGLQPLEIRTDLHPKASEGAAATTAIAADQIKDENGKYDPEMLKHQLTQWVTHKMAGPASHEVFRGATREELKTGATHSADYREARQLVREAYPDWNKKEVEDYIDQQYDRAHQFLTQEHIAGRIRANASTREEGLPETLHASRGRLNQFAEDIRKAHNDAEGNDAGPDGGGTGEGSEKPAKKPESGAAGREGTGSGDETANGKKKNKGRDSRGSKEESRGDDGTGKNASGSTQETRVNPDGTIAAVKDGKEIGSIKFNKKPIGESLNQFENPVEIDGSRVDEGERGKGVGKSLYKKAIEEAKKQGYSHLVSDYNLSPDSERVWQSLSKEYPVQKIDAPEGAENAKHGDERGVYDLGDPEAKKHRYVIDLQKEENSKAGKVYKPSEKAETLSGEAKDYGPEFNAAQHQHQIDLYKSIARNPKATPEEKSFARERLVDLQNPDLREVTSAALRKSQIPPERTTGDTTRDEAIKAGGGIPGGTMGDISMFHSPSTGSTLALKHSEITPERVKSHIASSDAQFGPEQKIQPEESSQARKKSSEVLADISRSYGVHDDPKVERTAGFITPDARYIDLPVDHTQAIEEHGGPKAGGAVDNRKDFINDTGAIRVHKARERAGNVLAFSVPKDGVTDAQAEAMARSFGKNGDRNGVLRIERADISPETRNKLSTEQEFPSASQIKPMLQKIDGLREETSNANKGTAEKANDVAKGADDYNKERSAEPVVPGTTHSPEVAKRIADAYDAMKHDPTNPAVKASYEAFKNDIDKQWDYATNKMGMKFEPWKQEGQPYANSKEMVNDVRNNKHLSFYQGGDIPAGHPTADIDPKTGLSYNDKFRAVHDLFGHAANENQFGPKGEENAWNEHRQMFSPEAIPAMTTETRAQNSWVNFGKHLRDSEGNVPAKGQEGYVPATERPYAEQKAGLLPEEFNKPNGSEDNVVNVHKNPADSSSSKGDMSGFKFTGQKKNGFSEIENDIAGVPTKTWVKDSELTDAQRKHFGGAEETSNANKQVVGANRFSKAASDWEEKQGEGYIKLGDGLHPRGSITPDNIRKNSTFLLPNGDSYSGLDTHEEMMDQKPFGGIPDGSIRLASNTGGNEFAIDENPSPQQRSELARLIKENNGKGQWDLRGPNSTVSGGGSVGNLTRDLDKAFGGAEENSNAQRSPKGSSVPLMKQPLDVKGTGEGGKPTTLDVAKALNDYSQEKHPALAHDEAEPKDMVARASKIAEDEAKYQLAQGRTGKEWYTEEMKDHDKVLAGMRPNMTGGPDVDAVPGHSAKMSLFKAAEAVLSSGQKPYANIKSALNAWDAYQKTGQFPPYNPETGKSWGPRNVAAYGNALESVNKLIGEKGEKGAADWLLADHPVSELKQYNPEGVKGKKDDMVPGAMILGPKRGPFFQNLHGLESAFTADMWVTRSWNRWMGTIETGTDARGLPEITSDSPRNGTERSLMKQSFSNTADKLGLSTSSLQAVLWYYEQGLYRAHGVPKESWSFSDAAKRVAQEEKAPVQRGLFDSFGGGKAPEPEHAGSIHALDFINALRAGRKK